MWHCVVMGKPFAKHALVFMGLQYKSFENTAGKGEIARNEQFLLFPQCFLPIWRTFYHFHYRHYAANHRIIDQMSFINSSGAMGETKSFCGKYSSRSECTERAV